MNGSCNYFSRWIEVGLLWCFYMVEARFPGAVTYFQCSTPFERRQSIRSSSVTLEIE